MESICWEWPGVTGQTLLPMLLDLNIAYTAQDVAKWSPTIDWKWKKFWHFPTVKIGALHSLHAGQWHHWPVPKFGTASAEAIGIVSEVHTQLMCWEDQRFVSVFPPHHSKPPGTLRLTRMPLYLIFYLVHFALDIGQINIFVVVIASFCTNNYQKSRQSFDNIPVNNHCTCPYCREPALGDPSWNWNTRLKSTKLWQYSTEQSLFSLLLLLGACTGWSVLELKDAAAKVFISRGHSHCPQVHTQYGCCQDQRLVSIFFITPHPQAR